MLIKVDDLKRLYPKFNDIDNNLIKRKLSVIEEAIRSHTHNNFQNRLIRINAAVVDGKIIWETGYLNVDDTIEISDGINKGLYTIKTVSNSIETIEPLYDYPTQLITKIEYPKEVVEGAIDILDWELIQKGKEKTGIASETISRHSQTFIQRTKDNMVKGYPIELFDFCDDYMKARF